MVLWATFSCNPLDPIEWPLCANWVQAFSCDIFWSQRRPPPPSDPLWSKSHSPNPSTSAGQLPQKLARFQSCRRFAGPGRVVWKFCYQHIFQDGALKIEALWHGLIANWASVFFWINRFGSIPVSDNIGMFFEAFEVRVHGDWTSRYHDCRIMYTDRRAE